MTALQMTPDEALALAEEKTRGETIHPMSTSLFACLLVLAEEVRRLRAEVVQARETSQFHKDNHLAAEREIERLRADARRLDHLIASGAFRMISADMGGKHTWAGIGRPIGRGPTVRDAIDRAMEATNAG